MLSMRYIRLMAVQNKDLYDLDYNSIQRAQFILTLPTSLQMFYLAGGITDCQIDMLLIAKSTDYEAFVSPFAAMMFFFDHLMNCTLLPGDMKDLKILFPDSN
jgi:hypothetical protein